MSKQDDAELTRFEAYAESVDTATLTPDYTDDLRAVALAADAVSVSREALDAAVVAARANGRSWTAIGIGLGVSRQAAWERYARATERHASHAQGHPRVAGA